MSGRRSQRAYQTNAASREQNRWAKRLEADRTREEAVAMHAVLSTAEGRAVLWRLLEHCKLFESTWDPSAMMHYLEGKRDVGLFVLGEVMATDPELWITMQREAQAREDRRDRTAEAAQVTATAEVDDGDA